MFPILLSIGPIHVFSYSVFFILAWLVFAFLFWRALREYGVDEERIFDFTFFATLAAFVSARLSFVVFHWSLFSQNILKIVAIWVSPGMSFLGGLVGMIVVFVFMGRSQKVRLAYMLDAVALALPASMIVGEVGSLLDGTIVGKAAHLPWAVWFVGQVGKRHPVQLYEIFVLVVISVCLFFIKRKAEKNKWPYGIIGVWFFLLLSISFFVLEFFHDTRVYLAGLSANQWVLVGIFGEALGAFYVRGGGREAIRPFIRNVYAKISKRPA